MSAPGKNAPDRQPIAMICTVDLAGQVRGKGVPRDALDVRMATGVPWTPTNSMITSFGVIAPSPWGALGDVWIRPDPATRIDLPAPDGGAAETLLLGDVMTPEGESWLACPRGFAKRMLAALEERHGLRIRAAFEHEFAFDGSPARPADSYSLASVRRSRPFLEDFAAALAAAGMPVECIMAEFGPNQFEATAPPAEGLAAADRAVAFKEIARAVAERHGGRASFAPILDPDGVGNGAHVHFSLSGARTGAPVNRDPARPQAISEKAGAFLAGVMAKLPAMLALTVPTTASYIRLRPNKWTATSATFAVQDREAAVRVCPVFAHAGDPDRQFHFEFRAADGAANPYLVLGAIVAAGLDGLDRALAPPTPTDGAGAPLPTSLEAALDLLEADGDLAEALGAELHAAFVQHKRFEASLMTGDDEAAQCRRYAEVF